VVRVGQDRLVRILLVSQMYPGPTAPQLGTFVLDLERALVDRGHVIERAVVDRRGGRSRHLALARDVVRAARGFRPDVCYAHFLAPAGLLAVLAGRAPTVLTAHGQDVENARGGTAVRHATRLAVARASAVVAVSGWLRDRLLDAVPAAAGKIEVIDAGVDVERFAPADQAAARAEVGWHPQGVGYLFVGTLSERKNVLRLARAVERLDDAELAIIGDGPLAGALGGRESIRLVGLVDHAAVPRWMAAADVVCQPSLQEPFGLATLEAMACGRPVLTTAVGGPPEFVPPGAGVVVDPLDDEAIAAGLSEAATLACPNDVGRAAAETHDVRLQAERVEALLLRAAQDRPS
jgi:glycosyltransferase involved in cell wall biosynthesis